MIRLATFVLMEPWAIYATVGGVFGVLFFTVLYYIFKAVDTLFGINRDKRRV